MQRVIRGSFVGLLIGWLVFWAVQPTHALPEYATRTGEPCATCHVNPAGGGPRTLRGLLWVARGKPDRVPELPVVVQAGPPEVIGPLLFASQCAGCHGATGDGVWAPALNEGPLQVDRVHDLVAYGLNEMPAFQNRLTPAQIDAVAQFVHRLSVGQAPRLPAKATLPPAQFKCARNAPSEARCGGN